MIAARKGHGSLFLPLLALELSTLAKRDAIQVGAREVAVLAHPIRTLSAAMPTAVAILGTADL
jgi:hypothetical protein